MKIGGETQFKSLKGEIVIRVLETAGKFHRIDTQRIGWRGEAETLSLSNLES